MPNFGLIRSFDIDNDELAALTPQECFVLGYELAQIDQLLESSRPIHRIVHADNADRIAKACTNAGRRYKLAWLSGDASESWMILDVAPETRAA